ncbi:MAG: helix-turn-helix domain-containing protein [Thermoplasmata archaeon]|nr:helix-turn-helix domain-containing protein [Thermoplasmata archaeon]
MRTAPEIRLSREERRTLVSLSRSGPARSPTAFRSRIVLRASEGVRNRDIANELHTDPGTVARWRQRFLAQRIPGVKKEAPRPGRPPAIPASSIQALVRATLERKAPDGTSWTTRSLARAMGVSKTTVHRVWQTRRIRPRGAGNSPAVPGSGFVDRVTDFVGLYLNPPERAMAFCVDDKARAASLDQRERDAIAELGEPDRGARFLSFLQAVDRETPKGFDLHLVLDRLLAPSSPTVHRWLVRHPRFYLHFLPAEATHPNLVDRWFGEFTKKRIRRTALPSVMRLHRAIQSHLGTRRSFSRPFVWTATTEEIRGSAGRDTIQ